MSTEQYISLKILAAKTNLPKGYLNRLTEENKFPVLLVNGKRRFLVSAVRKVLDGLAEGAVEPKRILLNRYECAEQLQVTPKWLKAVAIKGDVPCLRIGKQIMRFELQAVIEAVALLAAQSRY